MPQTDLTPPETKKQPPYGLWILDDDVHTLVYVVVLLSKVFKYEPQKCLELATEAHEKGKALVWSGSLEVGELKRDQMMSGGPDVYGNADKPVDAPMRVRLEPMP